MSLVPHLIRPGQAGDAAACERIALSLPDYFDAAGLAAMAADLPRHRLFVADREGRPVGFMTVAAKGPQVAEISWMAVTPGAQGQGCGTALMDAVCKQLAHEGCQVLEVKTLAADVDYAPYERTRAFYERSGFLLVETVNPYPTWGAENPCAIYVKVLRP